MQIDNILETNMLINTFNHAVRVANYLFITIIILFLFTEKKKQSEIGKQSAARENIKQSLKRVF